MKKFKQKKHDNLLKSPEFLSLLTKSYVVFSLVILLFVSGVFALANFLLNSPKIYWLGYDITDYTNILVEKKFLDLPIKDIVGDGYLEIYTVNGDLIFTSSDKPLNYTLGELDLISDFTKKEITELSEFETQLGTKQYLIRKKPNDSNSENESQYMLLSSDYTIIQTNFDTLKKQLTFKEFQALTFNAVNQHSLTKYIFSANDGNSYTAVMYDTSERIDKTPIYIIVLAAVSILIIYLVLLSLLTKYLIKLVRQPLNALEIGMYRFSIGNYDDKLNYKGTREFENITQSFNDMVDLLEKNEQEKAKLEEDKNRILAGLSHDLKTPITVIQGFAKALNDGMVKEEEKQKYLETIEAKSEYMAELINKMYDFNKLDHPDFALKLKKCDIVEITRQYFAEKYNEFEIQGFKLNIELPEQKYYANIDKSEYLRVYDNIISNFMKYNPAKTEFKVCVYTKDENIIITLSDNGTGIPENLVESIFKPFAVGDPSRSSKGSGLGLAISKRIIEMSDGNLTLSSNNEYKTVFKIILPKIEM